MDKHVLTAVVASNGAHEAEPVVGENRGSEVVLTLDDGTALYLDAVELRSLLDHWQPALRAA